MDISLIYYHLFNKENLCTIGDFLPENIPHYIQYLTCLFILAPHESSLTVQYHSAECSKPVNLNVKGSDFILKPSRHHTEHITTFYL